MSTCAFQGGFRFICGNWAFCHCVNDPLESFAEHLAEGIAILTERGNTYEYKVIVGSSIADGRDETKSASQMEPLSAPPKLTPGGGETCACSGLLHSGRSLNHLVGVH